jgi:hypothetical protein
MTIDGDEVHPRADESSDRSEQIVGEGAAILRGETQCEGRVEAVDDDRRRRSRVVFRPTVEDAPVIVDGGFGAEAAHEADGGHDAAKS